MTGGRAPRPTARLRFWGVRGSVPAPGPATARYGGNTSCVALEGGNGDLLVLDAGTGIRPLGRRLSGESGAGEITILVTHTHWDHIHGLPFFRLLYDPGRIVRLIGPAHPGVGLRQVLERLTVWENFPVPSSSFVSLASVTEAPEGPFRAGQWEVSGFRLCHAGPTLGFRLECPGVSPLAYMPDNELAGGLHGVGPHWRRDLVDFLRGVETLVHDATNDEDQRADRKGWGHSSPHEAVRLAGDAGCRRLVLFHHDPDRDDAAMDRLLDATRGYAASAAPGLSVEAAMEGMTLPLTQEAG